MRRMSITKFWWAPVLLICSTGCMVRLGSWSDTNSNGVSVRNGTVYMDGVELPFERWVDVNAEMGDAAVARLSTSTGELSVRGAPGTAVDLEVLLVTEFEGDGGATFEAGKLQAVAGQGKAFINGVRGTIPENVSAKLVTGTGSIRLTDMHGDRTLTLVSGTGPIEVGKSTADLVDIEMGTDTIRITDTDADRMEVDTGTGDLYVVSGGGSSLRVDTGTGDVELSGARFGSVFVDSGTGDVVLKECHIGRVEVDSGTGDLILRGGQYEKVELDSGTGDLRIKEGAVVGVKHEN